MAKEFSRYSMLVEWSEADGCFVVTVPELPGCMADGKTKAEAISMGEEAIKEWISAAKELGLEIPQPTICTVIK
ncbi:MAG: type II toxin-antitoxin system HicB family antitoxin [Parcubacteria group bacterium]|nr:type II toxin-antitoxin system HicB family antitoxin [Parcubacteria group bacterium]